jgi:prepilin-type N-terminal cleavage/methylation domain-containing protein
MNPIHMRAGDSAGSPRRGFTLIEMIVVILIVSILAALTAAGTFQFIETQRSNNTQNAMRTIDHVLQQQWEKVIDDAKKEAPSAAVQALAGSDNNGARAKVIWTYFRLVEAFPLSFDEIRAAPTYAPAPPAPNGYIPLAQRRYTSTYKGAIPATGSGSSSACLYLALTQNRGGVALVADQIASNVSKANGYSELIDSWGNPFRFERFPVGTAWAAELDSLNPAAANTRAAKLRDLLDPDGWLQKPGWTSTEFERVTGINAVNFNKYRVPSIISSGRDGMPDTVVKTDDVYSFRLRLGVRGD